MSRLFIALAFLFTFLSPALASPVASPTTSSARKLVPAKKPMTRTRQPVHLKPTTHRYTTGPASGHHYTNKDGVSVHSPMHAATAPAGACAVCNDGTYSFSQHRRGTCSHHGGVRTWL